MTIVTMMMNKSSVAKVKCMRDMNGVPPGRQRGAVLIVALVLLLLLTLVAIAGMRDTQLQEKMAGGAEDRAIAFQAAEAALREAEALIADGDCSSPCSDNGYYSDTGVTSPTRDDNGAQGGGTAVSEINFWTKHFSADGASANYWDDATKVKIYDGGGTALPDVTTQPHYVIELLPSEYTTLPKTTNGGSSGSGTVSVRDYLITARGTGRTDDAVVILQSMYRFVPPPTP